MSVLIEDLTSGFEAFFVGQMETLDRVADVRQTFAREAVRVDGLIRADVAYRIEERDRSEALTQLANGLTVNAQVAALAPTPEWMARGNALPHTAHMDRWTDAKVVTVRRREENSIKSMWLNGSLNDETYAACRWLQGVHELAGLEPSARVANYEMSIRGSDNFYAHLPASIIGAEARADYHYAMKQIPADPPFLKTIFLFVVIGNESLNAAARRHRCRKTTAKSAVVIAANRLFEAVAHRIDVAKFCGA